ncbi:unnamed protein product [Paramecium primaurelia]|uniref:Phospholipase/carboxylesterase/thioesterase domain-containing protein n=1 Tax=Paramecium primaurelia TaxID=5886 RepID=A0A8S1Q3V8_PARPR|nr:unnamed protein product [Paramecium primaurelia]
MLSLKELIPALTKDFTQGITRVDKHIYIQPKKEHKYTFIWMHGLEDVPDSFLAGFNNPELNPFDNQTTKVILLCAPVRPLTKNKGEMMTSWYDIMIPNWKQFWGIKSDKELWGVDQAIESRNFIWNLIDQEPIPKKNIFIGGFSQGCCMSLLAGLGYKESLGGILGNSGYLFPFTEINNKTPIQILHGEEDEVIPYEFAEKSIQPLFKLQNKIELIKLKGIEHAMMMDNFQLMKKFVTNCLS